MLGKKISLNECKDMGALLDLVRYKFSSKPEGTNFYVFCKKNDGSVLSKLRISKITDKNITYVLDNGDSKILRFIDLCGESDWATQHGFVHKDLIGFNVHYTNDSKTDIDGIELYKFYVDIAGMNENIFNPNKRLDTIAKIYNTADRIFVRRHPMNVMMQLMSEVGELAQEMRVINDENYYKSAGKDGVLGEACDVLISLIDLISQSGYTLGDIERVTETKLQKWTQKTEGYLREIAEYDVIEFNVTENGIENYKHHHNLTKYKSVGVVASVPSVLRSMDSMFDDKKLVVCDVTASGAITITLPSEEAGEGFDKLMLESLTKNINEKGINITCYDIESRAIECILNTKKKSKRLMCTLGM